MFRASDPQRSLFNAFDVLTDRQQTRMKGTWADGFRRDALPLIEERAFAGMSHDRLGAPNKPIRLMIGVLILKDLSDLTDEEALDALMFDARWHVALDLDPADAVLCQKSLHNFRVALMESDLGRTLFEETTGRILEALDLSTAKQRMDSTHITSHIARLTRLGTCCETIGLFLKDLKAQHPEAFAQVPESLRARYFRPDGSASKYDDATREEVRRRLPVVARDVYRLWDRFRTQAAIAAGGRFLLLARCLEEQCELVAEPQVPGEKDRDAGEEAVPVQPLDKKKLRGTALATPHDPAATFGAKGLGYEVHLAETFGNKAADVEGEAGVVRPELITYVAVTASCAPDVFETLPALEDLARRDMQPVELEVDGNYTGREVVLEAASRGTEVKGGDKYLPQEGEITLAEFTIVTDDGRQTRCPQGHAPREQTFDAETGQRKLIFDVADCQACPLRERCPTTVMKKATKSAAAGSRQLRTTREKLCTAQRRRYQTTDEFRKRYANRAGIEATNSELKRRHGLGRLRVRGLPRVNLAVLLKVVACNLKRYLQYQQALALG